MFTLRRHQSSLQQKSLPYAVYSLVLYSNLTASCFICLVFSVHSYFVLSGGVPVRPSLISRPVSYLNVINLITYNQIYFIDCKYIFLSLIESPYHLAR